MCGNECNHLIVGPISKWNRQLKIQFCEIDQLYWTGLIKLKKWLKCCVNIKESLIKVWVQIARENIACFERASGMVYDIKNLK